MLGTGRNIIEQLPRWKDFKTIPIKYQSFQTLSPEMLVSKKWLGKDSPTKHQGVQDFEKVQIVLCPANMCWFCI